MLKNTKTSKYILDTSRDYAIYVCDQRAIPMVSDGLKSGQRKALWTIKGKSDKIKTVSLSGEMISSGLYVHGDQSASQTISLMAGPYCNNIPYLYGIGSFGTRVNPQAFGAPRYTYVKKNRATEELLFKDLDIIPLKENYDGSTLEPVTFLPLIPTVLLNGISGIAVGWSTDILPHSIRDLIDATVAAIDGKKIRKLAPEYSYLDIEVRDLGGNQWEFLGKIDKIDGSSIKVKSLPPDLSLEKFRERLDQYEEEDKILDYTDNSAEEIDIQIKFKRGSISDWTEEKIVDFLKLKTKKTERIVVINFDGNSVKQYENPESLIVDFVNWRFGYYVKRYEKLLLDSDYELKYWYGVKACFDSNLPNKLLKCKNKGEIVEKISKSTKDLDDKQLDKIAGLPTYRWCTDYYEEVLAKIKELEAAIQHYAELLSDHSKIRTIYRDEVNNMKKIKW